MARDKQFNNIFLGEKTIKGKDISGYKIFTSKTEFKTIEAQTADEAIRKSGVKDIYKIEKIGVVTKSIFLEDELAELKKEINKAVEIAKDNITEAATDIPAENIKNVDLTQDENLQKPEPA